MNASVCVHQLIEAQARLTPDSVALEFRDQCLTYSELEERSTKLANFLRTRNLPLESLIGVCLDRSLELSVALIAIMKAGCAYLPLDPGFPEERLAYMVEDAGCSAIVTSRSQSGRFTRYAGDVIELERSAPEIAMQPAMLEPNGVGPDHLAYVIYTSGSTGKPKGVMIQHGAVVNLLRSMQKEPGATKDDIMLAVSTFSFDIAVPDLYLLLTVGGKTVIADRDTATDGKTLAAELIRKKVTLMQATPATWRMLIAGGWAGGKRLKALCGGEAMSKDLAERLLQRAGSVWNMYGPTETTVWSLLARVDPEPGSVTIGRPIANTTAYVLGDDGREVPRGATGKLFIGGQGLARGYSNQPALTAQKFIANQFGERIYDTGDLARIRADGQFEWLGRQDNQVKIRGHRIELEEIQFVLAKHQAVSEAAVVVRDSNTEQEKRLVAYVVPSGTGKCSTGELRRHVLESLPAYMAPSAFWFLDSLPLTPNGKLDRKALLTAEEAGLPIPEKDRALPQTSTETMLLRIFEDLLPVSPLAVTDNFIECGGNSLLAAQLVVEIERQTGHTVPAATLFEAPTVRQLARKIEDRTYSGAGSRIVELRKGDGSIAEPLFCIHWLDAKLVTFYKIASLLRDDRPVYGLQPGDLGKEEPGPRTIEEMAAVYLREIRTHFPKGPYHLAGSCLGGVVAFEIAQQLIAEGEQVKLLLLIDAYLPGALQYLHTRKPIVEYADRYFGEFLMSPSAAMKRWLLEGAVRLFARSTGNSLSRASSRFKKASREAEASYRPKQYPGKVTLLICSDGPFRAYEDRRLAWSSVADGGFEVHVVPGNHSTMEQEPNLRVLGERFQHCFDRLDS